MFIYNTWQYSKETTNIVKEENLKHKNRILVHLPFKNDYLINLEILEMNEVREEDKSK